MKWEICRSASRILRAVATSHTAPALALCTAVFLAWPEVSRGQTVAPSQVTPQTLRPPTPSPTDVPQLGAGARLVAPSGAEALSFVVGRVVIEGTFPELDGETKALSRAIEKHRVTVAKVYEFANALEEAYARAGYVLVRVTVPDQKLNDHGVLRIVVVDGFVEKVKVDNVPDRVRALVAERMASLIGRRHIKLDEIERRLLIAGDVPGLRLKSTLARGTTLGGTLLVLEGTQHLVTGTAFIDNRLPSSLGTWSYGTSVALNSAFGLGEQFYASAQSSGDPARMFDSNSPFRVLGAGAVLPLGTDGWIVNPEYTNSRSVPVPVNDGLASIGQFQRFALRSSYPVIRTRTSILSVFGAYEYISQNVALPDFETDLNRDRYSVLRAGTAYEAGLPWWGAALQSSATLSQGIGGRNSTDELVTGIPLSRQGANPLFTKANFDARFTVPLPESFRFDLITRAQTSFGRPMLVSEQFSLDGPLAISAYPSGTLNVDEGATLRGEFSRPFWIPGPVVPIQLSPYGFGVFGIGRLAEPTVVELAVIQAGAVGFGVRSGIDVPGGYQGAALALEVARQFSNLPNIPHGWRANIGMSVRF
jgi:hemolysin activation/secretion protein